MDDADAVVKSYVYDAYGNTTETGTFTNSFAYTGAVIDGETGLYYMNARYYEPATGRFISTDTYRGDGELYWNLYVYCNDDPINCADITGHSPNPVYDKVNDVMYFEDDVRVALTDILIGGWLTGLRYSVAFLKNSMGRACNYTYTKNSALSIKIMSIKNLKTHVLGTLSKYLKRSGNRNKTVITNLKDSYEITKRDSEDLFYALHKVSLSINVYRKLCGKTADYWKADVTLFDTTRSIANRINNYGYAAQKMGIIKPFKIKVMFGYGLQLMRK